uniref:Uncharacterized protein n=1 Tax=Glossina brevipalpis TaxID=37001 RepID=A0A1A9W3B3_9MUSC
MQTSFKMWFKFKNVVHTIITDTLHLLFLTILLGYPFNVNVCNIQAMDYYSSTSYVTAAPAAALKIIATSFKATTSITSPHLVKGAVASAAAVNNADDLFLLRTQHDFLKETKTTTNLTTHHLPNDNDIFKSFSITYDIVNKSSTYRVKSQISWSIEDRQYFMVLFVQSNKLVDDLCQSRDVKVFG